MHSPYEKDYAERKEEKLINGEEYELLNYALKNGILNLSHTQEQIEEMKRKELLDQHPYKIWEGKNGNWFTYIPCGENEQKLRRRKTKSEIEDLVIDYWKHEAESPTIKELFHDMNDKKLELKKISAATYTRNRQIFNRFFDEFGNRKIRSVSVDDFVCFLEEQIPKYELTSKAFANLKGVTSAILKYARRKKLVSYSMEDILLELDTSDRDFRKSVKFDEEEVFNAEETDAIVRYLIQNQDIWNLGILLLFVTGMRVGELVALHWEDVSPEAIFIRRTETRFKNEDGEWEYAIKDSPKTAAGARVVVIPQAFQWIIGAIRELHDDKEFVFVRDGKRLNTNCIRKRFTRVCKNANVACKSPHKIRKTYCSILFENHLDTRLITDQMGHTDIMCSELYYHRNRKSLDEKVETISAIPDFQPKMTLIV